MEIEEIQAALQHILNNSEAHKRTLLADVEKLLKQIGEK
jgi:hypothetical protein